MFMYISLFVIIVAMGFLAFMIALDGRRSRETFANAVPDAPATAPVAAPAVAPAVAPAPVPVPTAPAVVAAPVPAPAATVPAPATVPTVPAVATAPKAKEPEAAATAAIVPPQESIASVASSAAETVKSTLPVKKGSETFALSAKEKELFEDLKANKLNKNQVETLINAGILNNQVFEKFLNILGQTEAAATVGKKDAVEGFTCGPAYSAF